MYGVGVAWLYLVLWVLCVEPVPGVAGTPGVVGALTTELIGKMRSVRFGVEGEVAKSLSTAGGELIRG
jgi:hypothetical protein